MPYQAWILWTGATIILIFDAIAGGRKRPELGIVCTLISLGIVLYLFLGGPFN